MKVLVTGANGFIGHALAEMHRRAGDEVFALARRHRESPAGGARLLLLESHPGSKNRFLGPLQAAQPELILHCAGSASVPASFRDPDACHQANVGLVEELLEGVRQSESPGCVVLPSSAAVYGSPEEQPIREDTPRRPISPYGSSKVQAEDLLATYASRHGVRAISMRIFSLYGPGQRKLLVWELIRQALQGAFPLSLQGSGDEVRDYLHISDLHRAILAGVASGPRRGEPYNTATGTAVPVGRIAAIIASAFGRPGEIRCLGQAQPGAPPHWRADVSRLAAAGFRARVSLEDGLAETIAWARGVHV